MAFSREIIKKVLQYVQFRVPATEEKDSYYTQIGDTLVRLSNHCTRLYVWDDILEKNPKWKGLPIVSIVFEDAEVTFNEVECLTLKRFRKKPIKVNEYVYNLQGNPQFITPQYEKLIIQSIKNINEGQYKDTTNKCSPPQVRISRNPTNENKEYKTKKDMKKQVIRLTEEDLHNIIKESVNRALNEGKLGSAYENLENASALLKDIMDSNFIPFSSPNPSSTEEDLKKTIIEAARMIDKAMYLCGQLGYNNPVANVV